MNISCTCRKAALIIGALLTLWWVGEPGARGGDSPNWVLSCAADNDIFLLLSRSGQACARHDDPAKAIAAAPEGAAVLLLADGYPGRPLRVEPGLLASARARKLRVYMEFPESLPGFSVGEQRTVVWERAVVSSGLFGSDLPEMSILSPQNCVFRQIPSTPAHLVLARVAGYNAALFGLPATTFPLLFEMPDASEHGEVLVAATKLSQVVTARFGPAPSWQAVWRGILRWLNPDLEVELNWTPTVRPAYTRTGELPSGTETAALRRGADWFIHSRLLLHASRTNEVGKAAVGDGLTQAPSPGAPVGDGSLGLLEGYYSRVQPDGSQLQSVSVRGDCNAEGAMALAFSGTAFQEPAQSAIARRLLDFYYFDSPARKNERGDPKHGAYGLISWGVGTPAWYVANYGDDNARLLLGTMAASALLNEDRWDEAILQCLLANLRTTGTLGFRGDRIDIPELTQNGWEFYFHRRITSFAPHYESYLWACYLWAYHKTGFELFRDRAKSAIRRTMEAYPDRWRWTNGLQQERARMLLCLSWLVRVEDTAEHRAWLRRMAEELLARQDESGAIREEIGELGRGQMHPPQSNEAYGTGESPLLQKNGDPVCDLLYTCNFAMLGLHEAAAATADPFYVQAADKLTRFLCRIQVRSERHPELDGGWFRAFDYRLWDYWASNADAGWGAWSIESGWTQGWITSVLAMRQMKTSLWDLTARSRVARHFDRLRPEMMPDSALKAPPTQLLRHAGVGKAATLLTPASDSYPGDGPASLTDGVVAGKPHQDGAWLGFLGKDLVLRVDLGEPVPLHQLGLSCLQNVPLGIFLPKAVEFRAGKTLDSLQLLGTATTATDVKENGPLKETLWLKNLATEARYLEARASNLKRLPSWHPAAGSEGWLFVDEVIVNPAQP